MEGMTEAEIKKLQSKRRRAAAKAAEEAEEAAKGKDKKVGKEEGEKKKGKAAKEDVDPDGALLAKAEKPLDETRKFLNLLQEHAGGHLETHLMCCEVFGRKGRPLKVLQALKRAAKVAEVGEARLHVCAVKFLTSVEGAKGDVLAPVVKTVVEEELGRASEWGMAGLRGGAAAYAEKYVGEYGGKGITQAVAAAQGLVAVGAAGAAKRGGEVIGKVGVDGVKLAVLEEAHTWMAGNGMAPEVVDAFRNKCLARFPLSSYFKGVAAKQ